MYLAKKYLVNLILLMLLFGNFFGIDLKAPKVFAATSALLQSSDFTYLGYYNVDLASMGLDNPFGQGLTSRYVNGDFRLMYLNIDNQVKEFSLAGKNLGDDITTETNTWPGVAQFIGTWVGLWWDAASQRLWTTSAIDYNTSFESVRIVTQSLNNDGTVSNVHGPVGLNGIDSKRVYGGVQPVPTWFQQAYGVGPYAVGWGGYTSILCVGPVSLGPTMYTIPDPSGYANNTEIPANSYKTIMDNSSGSCTNDWYSSGAPTNYDRGVRLTTPLNYYDGGEVGVQPPNGTGDPTPTGPPNSSGQWLSPAPDGLGRWVWGDSYGNTGVWIDTPNKSGFVAIASLCGGKCYYGNSTLHSDSRVFEMHIFDPAKLGQAAISTLPVWNVKPSSMTQLNLPGLGFATVGNGADGNVGGATYDPTTHRLYLMGYGIGYSNRLYVFQVNTGQVTDTTPPTVSITSPANNATISGTINVSANASDNIAVAGVQFKLDGSNLGSEITSPFIYSWDTKTISNGSHILTAVARDTSNNTTTSSSVAITVSNSSSPPAQASDNFDRADGNSIGSNWTAAYGGNQSISGGIIGIHGNQAYMDGSTYGWGMEYWNANSFSNDQYSQFVDSAPASNSIPIAVVRGTGGSNSASGKGYAGYATGEIYKIDINGNWTKLTNSSGIPAAGDVIKLTAVGNTITLYRNGIQINQVTDNSYSSGSPGIGFYGATSYTAELDNWQGGNTTSTATPIPGDINLDHIVNSIDWSIMNAHWFTNYAPADLNSDGIVNSIDFSILNANWFKTW
jgi:hypothetical protein